MALPIRKQTTKKTTRKMASDATTTTMPVTLTSEVSYPAEGAPCPVGEMPWPRGSCSGVLGVCMFWLQNLWEMRIVDLDQGPLGELVQVGDHPERDHGAGYRSILQNTEGEVQVARREAGLDEHEHIPAAREDHPLAHDDDAALVALDIAREQQCERNQPVEDEVERVQQAPVPANAIQVPGDLFRRVAGPDDQELREVEVDVQHDEGEHQLAQVMLLGGAQDRVDRLGLRQVSHPDYTRGGNRIALGDQEETAVHGG